MAITQAQMATATNLLNGGLAVTSTATPALNGTYAVYSGFAPEGMQGQANALALSASASFADGSATLEWPDITGVGHSFTPAQFHSLVVACANFVSQCTQYAYGVITTPPAATATIP